MHDVDLATPGPIGATFISPSFYVGSNFCGAQLFGAEYSAVCKHRGSEADHGIYPIVASDFPEAPTFPSLSTSAASGRPRPSRPTSSGSPSGTRRRTVSGHAPFAYFRHLTGHLPPHNRWAFDWTWARGRAIVQLSAARPPRFPRPGLCGRQSRVVARRMSRSPE